MSRTAGSRAGEGRAVRHALGSFRYLAAWACCVLMLAVGCSGEDSEDNETSALLRDLSSSQPETRIAAARRLGALRETSAVEPLTGLLDDIRLDVRKTAAEALGRIGDARAVGALARVLGRRDADGELRRLCAAAMGSIADPAAVPALDDAMRSDDEELAFAAAYALAQIGDPALDALLAGLDAEHGHTKRAAATALGGLASDRAREAMRGLLDAPDPILRLSAAENLSALPEPAETDRIVAMLLDPDETVRRGVAALLDRLGPSAIPALTDIIERSSPAVQRTDAGGNTVQVSVRWAQNEAVRVLMRYDSPDVIRPLITALDRRIRNRDAVREHLRRRFGDDDCRHELLRLCGEGTPHERNSAFTLLYETIGPELVGNEDEDARRRVIERTGFRDPSELSAICEEASDSDDSALRFRASVLLCAMGDRRGKEVVERQFWQDIEAVRHRGTDRSPELDRATEALRALAGVADKPLGDQLVPLLQEGEGRGRGWDRLRGRIAAILGRIGDESYAEPLLAFVRSRPDHSAASLAARALGQIGAEEAFDELLRFVEPLPDDMYYVGIRSNFYEGLLGCDRDRAYREIGRIFVELQPHNSAGIRNMLGFFTDHPAPEVVEPLMHWINHDIALVRDDIHEALVAVGRSDLSWLIDGFEVRSAAKRSTLAGVIADGFDMEAVPLLLEAINDESPRKRQGAVWALGAIGGPDASEAVGKAMQDPHEAVRSAAIWSAGQLRNPEHVPTMINLLDDNAAVVRSMAAEQLGEMGSKEAVEPLVGVLNDDYPRVRAFAVMSLVALEAGQALDDIRELLDDPDPDVRAAAAYAVDNIEPRAGGAAAPASTGSGSDAGAGGQSR
ncbi:MAG: HEAT repeat domain-containing protein [Phycisphaerae bacterium]